LKFWTIFGVLLAIVGVIIFWNGINSLKSPKSNPSAEPAQSPVSNSQTDAAATPGRDFRMSRDDSVAVGLTPALKPEVVSTDSTPPETTGKSDGGWLKSLVKDIGERTKTDQKVSEPPKGGDAAVEYNFESDPGGMKSLVLNSLRRAGWKQDELGQLQKLLADPRARFREEILVRNSTFEETAEQYTHNLSPSAIERCVAFMRDQAGPIQAAAIREKVAPEVLVAILKVETNLGEWLGKESVLNVFWSLACGADPTVQQRLITKDVEKPAEMKKRMEKRAAWAKGQLLDLLFVARHGGEDPAGIMGSFAGAFGMPQFIPSSYRAYGRDGDGDGVIDLDALPDAATSIGYYLSENGWSNNADRAKKRKVILSYNHSIYYADCVLALADSIAAREAPASVIE
jgi:membrane-bound lytic murein transglycosylase B